MNDVRREFLFNHCGVFAVALHQRTEWPIVNFRRWNGQFVHSAVEMPDGRLVDFDGFVTPEDFARRYNIRGKVYPEKFIPGGAVAGYNYDGYTSMDEALAFANQMIDGLTHPPFSDLKKIT
jgi:hypothetical protein